MIKFSVHLLQIFITFWIILYCLGDKFIDPLTTNTQTTTTGTRLKQSEIDFLLNAILKYNKHLSLNHQLKTKLTPIITKNKENVIKEAFNYIPNNNDVTYPEIKRAFIPPLANALSKSEMNSLHDELNYLRNKVMEEVKQAKSRRSGKQETEEKFIPSISVGALANLQGFFETLGQNLESLEEKKLPLDQLKFLERDRGLEHHVRKELLDDSSVSAPMKPSGSAAFLHAIRNYRPAHKIRSLVALHPEGYFQTNFHDPYYLHAGLGK